MNVDELHAEAKKIWSGYHQMQVDEIAVAMGVVYGDICRQARTAQEGGAIDEAELKKELGNIMFSTIRWCGDLGFDPVECLELAKEAHRNYAARISQKGSGGKSGIV
jgi:hypothetical protein